MGSRWQSWATTYWQRVSATFALAITLNGGSAGHAIANVHRPITVGVYDNTPKLFWDEDTEQPAGFFPEIFADIARREGWQVRYVRCDWADCLTALEGGELDLMMDVAYSQSRDTRFDFNREVVVPSWSVVVARRENRFNSVLDLDGKRIGVLSMGIQYDALAATAQEFDIRPELVVATDYDELASLLKQGEVDGVIVNRFFPIADRMPGAIQTNILVKPTQLHFAVPNNANGDLLQAIDKHLAALKNQPNSLYYVAGERWLQGVDVYKTDWPMLRRLAFVMVLAMLGGTSLGLVLWNRSLRREVAKRLEAQSKLNYEVCHDGLTHLPNRNFLMEHLAATLVQVRAQTSPGFVLLFLDLDRFKVVNDSLGHLMGDKLLVAMAHRLSQGQHWVARLGGDEFVIMLEHTTDLDLAIQTANDVLKRLQAPCWLEGHEVTVGASIGIVIGTDRYLTPIEILRDADIAMYGAKAKGRNRYNIFDPAMQVKACQQLTLENDLRSAVKHHEFLLYYQPLIDLRSRHIAGFEALVRWQHPTQGLLGPVTFIPIAEETGLIIPLGWWILETACAQLAEWRRRHPQLGSITVSVNVSAAQLREPHWLQTFDQVLARTGLPGKNLILEITETLLMQNMDTAAGLLQALQERQVGISIDDFGTGYSSFSYLHQLPITGLKIDRLFIENLLSNTTKHQNIVKTMLVLARQMDLQVTAEGVSSEAQMTLLTAMGCDLGQGFWFDYPMPADQALQRLMAPASVGPALGSYS